MRFQRVVTLASTLGIYALIAMPMAAIAQEPNPAAKSGSPVGGNWKGEVTATEANPGGALTEEQTEYVKIVSNFFAELETLQGDFTQTDPDKSVTKGKFYVKRPGMFRFDYRAPSKKVIISDGYLLAIQDLDLGNEDIFELNKTPFRLLLSKDVNFLRDANIIDSQGSDDLITVTLVDKDPDTPGQIQLFMTRVPSLQLTEWVITDAQGLRTRVETTELVKNEKLEDQRFKRENLAARRMQQ